MFHYQKIRLFLFMFIFSIHGCSNQAPKTETQPVYLDELTVRKMAMDESADLYTKAMGEYKDSHLDKARKILQQAVQKDDRNVQAWMQLGVIEYEKSNYYEAASAFHKSSCLVPLRYEPHFNLGTVYETTSQFTDAIESYKKALELSPDQTEVMENLIRCYIRSNQNIDEAKKLINRALITEHRPQWRKWLEKEALRISLMKSTPTSQEAKNEN
jgi:tetratricopeptide (TPR) repeat protein